MKHQFTIKVPVYTFVIKVIISDNVEEYINKLKKKLGQEVIDGTVHGYAMIGEDVHTYYLFFDIETLDVSTISHEISHIIDYAFDDRDIPPKDEPRAYLTGHITEEIIKRSYKKKLLKDKWLVEKEVFQSNQLST